MSQRPSQSLCRAVTRTETRLGRGSTANMWLNRIAGEASGTKSLSMRVCTVLIATWAKSVSQAPNQSPYPSLNRVALMSDLQHVGLRARLVRTAAQHPGQNSQFALPSPPRRGPCHRSQLGPLSGSKTAGLMIDRQQLGLTALEVRSASQDPGQNSHVGLASPPKARRVSLGPS